MFGSHPPRALRHASHSLEWYMPGKEKKLYLTFDDGPVPDVTPWVLETLAQYQARATFFMVGDNARKYPFLLRQVQNAGHAVGNHTYHHTDGWKTRSKAYLRDISLAAQLIPSRLFRPPYGKIPLPVIPLLGNHFRIIMWSVLTRDYDTSLSPGQCLYLALTHTQANDIILFHDSIKAWRNMSYTLPRFLQYFSEKGYQFDRIPQQKIIP